MRSLNQVKRGGGGGPKDVFAYWSKSRPASSTGEEREGVAQNCKGKSKSDGRDPAKVAARQGVRASRCPARIRVY